MKFLAILLILAGCTASPPRAVHYARFDGKLASMNAWVEPDFRASEAKCRYQVAWSGNRSPDFQWPKGRTASGADVTAGMQNLASGMAAFSAREGLFDACMEASGYYVERME